MQRKQLLKRFLIALMMMLVMVNVAATVIAQDAEGEAQTTEEVSEEEHAEEEGGLLTPLGINSGLLFVQTFNFLLMAFIAGAFLWRPAVNFLDARSARIQKGLEDAAAAAKARQNAEAEAEKILAEARNERAKLIEEARSQGDEVAKQIQSEARTEAEKIRQDAATEAAAARDAQLAELRDDVLNISTAVASRILNEKIDASKQKSLVSDFLSKAPEGAKSLTGKVEVISAMPLTDDEKKNVEKTIGGDSYSYSVDPSILGGLIVRSQEKVVDGSVRSNLDALTERLS